MTRTSSMLSVRKQKRPRTLDPMPATVDPMLAVLSTLPANPAGYSFEFKWDGVRALGFWDGRKFRLQGRNQNEITARYPELRGLGKTSGADSAVFDGEIVALDDANRPSFALLQQRMHLSNASAIILLMKKVPALFVIFDLLYLNGKSLMNRPLVVRRKALEELPLSGVHWQISPAQLGEGASMLETARKNQLEGLVAKELDSVYEPGRRSPSWRKIKLVQRQEFVIGGWTCGNNGRDIGALLIGYHAPGDKLLRYAGKLGSGFTVETLHNLAKKLGALERPTSPFGEPVPGTGLAPGRWSKPAGPVHFVQPTLVAEIEYRRWPQGGLLQQAAFKGLRTDKRARDVVRERAV